MKFNDRLRTVVVNDMNNNIVPMLIGEPGIGKSSWLRDLAESQHTECFTVQCNLLADKSDLTGVRLVPLQDKDGKPIIDKTTGEARYKQTFHPHASIMNAIAYAEDHPREHPILFLDEINRTSSDVTSALLSIPTERTIGSYKLPTNLKVVIAGNDKGNVTALDEASISRFSLYRTSPDTMTFLGLTDDLNEFVKTVLQAHPETIFCKRIETRSAKDDDNEDLYVEELFDDECDFNQFTTPRTIMAVSNFLNGLDMKTIQEMTSERNIVDGEEICTLQEVIEGHVGRTMFSSLLLDEVTKAAVNQTTSGTKTKEVAKPIIYDELKEIDTIDGIEKFVKDMSEEDKSGCLVYAIYEPADNEHIIKALAKNLDKFIQKDICTLMDMVREGKCDAVNIGVFANSDTDLATQYAVILDAYM